MQPVGHFGKHLRIVRCSKERGDGILTALDVQGRLGDDALHELVEFARRKRRGRGFVGVAPANAGQIFQRDLHEHDVGRHRHQRLLVGRLARLDVFDDLIRLLFQPLPQLALANHAQGVRQLPQRHLKTLEAGDIALFGTDEEIDAILDLREIVFYGAPDGRHQFAVRPETVGVGEILLRGRNQVQMVKVPRFQDELILGLGAGDVVEDVLEKLVGREVDERLFSPRDNPSQFPVEPPQQLPGGSSRFYAPVAQPLNERTSRAEKGRHPFGSGRPFDLLERLSDHGEAMGGVAAAEPAEQGPVKT